MGGNVTKFFLLERVKSFSSRFLVEILHTRQQCDTREIDASNKSYRMKQTEQQKSHVTQAVHLYRCLFTPGTKEYE